MGITTTRPSYSVALPKLPEVFPATYVSELVIADKLRDEMRA